MGLDRLERSPYPHQTARRLKIYSMPSWDPDDDRGIDYFIAWIIKVAAKA
jgi:hypothetical protein